MGRIWLAIRVFFLVLFKGDVAQLVAESLAGLDAAALEAAGSAETSMAQTAPTVKPPTPKPKVSQPSRSEAITLLATLQREARFIDFIMEPLANYTDAQIGAAVRDVHRDCGKVLERVFSLQPVLAQEEGAQVEVAPGFDPARYRLVGNVVGDPPFHGHLVHHGWEAAVCQVPAWSGTEAAVRVVAPVEVELA